MFSEEDGTNINNQDREQFQIRKKILKYTQVFNL